MRGLVEEIRNNERGIQDICVTKSKMPRPHFIKSFIGHEVDYGLAGAGIKRTSHTVICWLPPIQHAIIEKQQNLINMQKRVGLPIVDLKEINRRMTNGEARSHPRQARHDRSQPAPGDLHRQENIPIADCQFLDLIQKVISA